MRTTFKNWKARCSSVGDLMSNLEKITEKQQVTIKEYQDRQKDPNQKPLTIKMRETLEGLIVQRDAPDTLPTGAKSYLDGVFRDEFWGRRRILHNKYLVKGNMMEQDGLALISKLDGVFYSKNEPLFENEFTKGTPDTIYKDKIIDVKCNWDFDTFDVAELTKTYMWQIKAYMWLTGKKEGELAYCLVNCPAQQVRETVDGMIFKLGYQDDEYNEKWIEIKKQIERNMIFDWKMIQDEYWDWAQSPEERDNSNIPPIIRSKRFKVTLTDEDIVNMKSRVLLARTYLIKKEIEVKQKLIQ